jgi:hypothetical protein
MTEYTTIAADIPLELEEEVTDYANGRGLTVDEVVAVALREFLDEHGLRAGWR